jgi:FixJ family two-component response regulator
MQAVHGAIDIAPFLHGYNIQSSTPAFAAAAEGQGETIHFIDSDPYFRKEFSALLARVATKVVTFSSASEYLGFAERHKASCVILNNRLPDLSGLELQRLLATSSSVPVIFISDPCDAASAVSAMKAGAIDFLVRPFDSASLVESVQAAFIQDKKRRQRRAESAELQDRLNLLTPREREVLPLVVGGLLNKQAAGILGISEVTLQIHRSQVMRKMRADSLADLVRMAMKLRIPYQRERLRA